jgi:hypothetical protein
MWTDRDGPHWHTSDKSYSEEPRQKMNRPTTLNIRSLLEYAANDYDEFAEYAAELEAAHTDAYRERKRLEGKLGTTLDLLPGELSEKQLDAIRAVKMLREDALHEAAVADAQREAYRASMTPDFVRQAEADASRATYAQREAAKYARPSAADRWAETSGLLDQIEQVAPR